MTLPGTSVGVVLIFDIGLSVVKAAVFRPDGSLVTLHEARNDAVEPRGDRSEMNLPRLWELVCEASAGVLAGGVDPASIAGIGLSAAGNGLFLVTPDGDDLIAITSMDRRAAELAEAWKKSPGGERALEVTGNNVWAGQPLPLLAHLKKEGALRDEFRLFFCKDWLRLRLTGEICTDRSDASAAGMLDVRSGEWAHDVLQDVGVGESVLPRLGNSTAATGAVTLNAAAKTGLPAGIPVFGGGIDLALGAWADGMGEPDVLHVTAGTWSINQLPCTTFDSADSNAFLQTIIAPDGDRRTLVDSSPSSAINLDLLCGLIGTATPDFSLWEEWLRDVRLSTDDPIYLPYPAGAWDLPIRSAEFRQLRAGLSPAIAVSAVYDGIALGHVRQIRKFQDRGAVRKLVVCGGMTRSDAWCQRLADYAELPMEVAANPHASSFGGALCAFAGLGIAATSQASKDRRCYQPEPSRVSTARYQRFCELIL